MYHHDLFQLIFIEKNSTKGINNEKIGVTWLGAVIEVEEYNARINQFYLFQKEFDITFSRFAKLGAGIKQMERKIAVLEKNYLELLASLSDAKLKKQNIEITCKEFTSNQFENMKPVLKLK